MLASSVACWLAEDCQPAPPPPIAAAVHGLSLNLAALLSPGLMNKFSSLPDSEFRPWTNLPDLDATIDNEMRKLEQTIHYTSASKHAGHIGDSEIDLKPELLRVFDEITTDPKWLDSKDADLVEAVPEEDLLENAQQDPAYDLSLPRVVNPDPVPAPLKDASKRHVKATMDRKSVPVPTFRFRNTPPGHKKRSKRIKSVKCSAFPIPAIAPVSAARFRELLGEIESGQFKGGAPSEHQRPKTACSKPLSLVGDKQQRPKSASVLDHSKKQLGLNILPAAATPSHCSSMASESTFLSDKSGSQPHEPYLFNRAVTPSDSAEGNETAVERIVTPLSLLHAQSKGEPLPVSPINPIVRPQSHRPRSKSSLNSDKISSKESRFDKTHTSISSALRKLRITPEVKGRLYISI